MEECSICLTELTIPIKLKCGHIFDFDCLLDYTYRVLPQSPICPMCRMEINIENWRNMLVTNESNTVEIKWITGNSCVLPINKRCDVHRIKRLLSMGLLSYNDVITGIRLNKEYKFKFACPYTITLCMKGKRLLSKDILDNSVIIHGYNSLHSACDECVNKGEIIRCSHGQCMSSEILVI